MSSQKPDFSAAFPLYQCFKKVRAIKIAKIEQSPADELAPLDAAGSWRIFDEGGWFCTVAHEWIVKHNPQPGGYFVVYDDGYLSFSPASAFESGYAPIRLESANTSNEIEQEILDKKLTAPRVTQVDIEANIVSEHYFIGSDAIQQEMAVHVHKGGWLLGSTQLLTFCILQLRNGFTVTGESACASPGNFDAELGRKIARQNAISKVWALMGYELRSKLARETEETHL